ncbi:hypothetical protein As57867_003588, partial [Aphanomyces stellatus]
MSSTNSTAPPDLNKTATVVFIFMGVAVMMIVVPCMCLRYYCFERRGEALLPNESLEATKWICGVCAFSNPPINTSCQLCDSPPATFVLAAPEFEAMDGTLRVDQLNPKQRAARFRKQWRRYFDGHMWSWVADLPPEDKCAYFVIGATDEGQSIQFGPLSSHLAKQTVLGRILPSWWFPHLEERRDLAFSLKYAWLMAYLTEAYNLHAKFTLSRATIFEQSMTALAQAPIDMLCRLTIVTLEGESAIDAGGVTREWYSLLALAILEPKQGLFITNKTDQSFFINPNSAKDHGPNHLERYLAIGRLLGRAIVDEQVLPFQFSVPLFKALLGYPVSIEDIRYLDAVVYSSLVFVRDCTSDVAELALTFSATLDASTEVDLVPNGRAIEVTCANKAEYIERMVQYLLFDRVAPQLEKMVQGLYDVLPQELLMPFDYKELELVLCGFA